MNTNFFNGRSLFTIDWKVDTPFRTHVHWFAILSFWHDFHFHRWFIWISKCLLKFTSKHCNLIRLWPSRSILRWISVVRNREIRNMVLLSTFGLLLTCFLFLNSVCLMCVWLEKTTVLFICMHKRVQLIIFAVSIKFCDESGLAILINQCLMFRLC